jgi:archaemetzincin
MPPCKHANLVFDVSPNAHEVGYKRATTEQRIAATQPAGRVPSAKDGSSGDGKRTLIDAPSGSTFPAPLVLTDDDLSLYPGCPPQSLRSWFQSKHRNPVTAERRTVYVVCPSETNAPVTSWQAPTATGKVHSTDNLTPPALQDVVGYLQAFYHGLPVKALSGAEWAFRQWESDAGRHTRAQLSYIGLQAGGQLYGVRTRERPDGPFRMQLNLTYLLDVAINALPGDAYALLMLVNYDLYEDEEDEFCCGRAYGGSRVAVVSTARYCPSLDKLENLDTTHAWPASHCQRYVDRSCGVKTKAEPRGKKRKCSSADEPETAMSAAVAACNAQTNPKNQGLDVDRLNILWLGRVCKTASHELGHCFCMGHCTYYACIMQGTAGLCEDARQPPYMCPVDTAKLLAATGAGEKEWLQALFNYCEKYPHDRLFAAFGAWLQVRVREVASSD